MLSSFVVAVVAFAAAAALRLRALAAITVVCWTQNLLLPWWYTEGWIGAELSRALIMLKEFMLVGLVVMLFWRMRWLHTGPLPTPIRVAMAAIAYIAFRVVLGTAFLGESLFAELRLVRSFLLPSIVVLAGFAVGMMQPSERRRYVGTATTALVACSVVSLLLFALAPDEFWANHVNIAAYNIDVKGDPEWTVDLEAGVSGTGIGRAVFSWLSSFRLIGTFGDPLTAGFVLGFGVLLLAARQTQSIMTIIGGLCCVAGLLLTFSRSAWIFTAIGLAYLAVRQRWLLRSVFALLLVAGTWLALGSDLAEFFTTSVAAFDLESGDVYHAEGLLRFWRGELFTAANILGQGPLPGTEQTATVENGFAYMIEQFGIPSFVAFAVLCVTLERFLRRNAAPDDVVAQVGAAAAISTLVVTNFSFYALSFTPYFAIWTLIGLCIGTAHRASGAFRRSLPVQRASLPPDPVGVPA